MANLTSRDIDVGPYTIHAVETIPTSSSTSPTVVLISGIGGTTVTWCAVQRLLPQDLRTFAYDRLGLGKSGETDLARPAALLATQRMTVRGFVEDGLLLLVMLEDIVAGDNREVIDLGSRAPLYRFRTLGFDHKVDP